MLKYCRKRYNDIPFAHRAPQHDGHCRFIHGHNWSFEFTFAATQADNNGFVVDFGKLDELKKELYKFDHKLVLATTDPELDELRELEDMKLAQIETIVDPSCEGLAVYFLSVANTVVKKITNGRAWCEQVMVWEDSRNSAIARIEP